MRHGTLLNIIEALAKAPRTTVQIGQVCGLSHMGAETAVRKLRDRGLIYVIERIPPKINGNAAAVYALQPGFQAHAVPDCPKWRDLSPQERWQARVDYYGEDEIERASEAHYEKCRSTAARRGTKLGRPKKERPTPTNTPAHLPLGGTAPGV